MRIIRATLVTRPADDKRIVVIKGEYDTYHIDEKQMEEYLIERGDICGTCYGSKEIDIPAEVRGGELLGPDNRPCPDCQAQPDEDGDGDN